MKSGLSWGLFMFVIMTIIWPLIDGEGINMKRIIVGLIIWTLGGLAFGWTMKGNFKEN